MSDAIHDMVAYTQLNDTVLQQIMMSENEEGSKLYSKQHIMYRFILQLANDLLRKVEQRKLWSNTAFIGI